MAAFTFSNLAVFEKRLGISATDLKNGLCLISEHTLSTVKCLC